jgi:hypothetical protein
LAQVSLWAARGSIPLFEAAELIADAREKALLLICSRSAFFGELAENQTDGAASIDAA